MITTVTNVKGGCGKTTIATSLAVCWSRNGFSVLLVDADPQCSARRWASEREAGPEVVGMEDHRLLLRQIPTLARRFDRIVIDTPPALARIQRAAICVCDIALIPAAYGGLETWALEDTLAALHEVGASLESENPAVIVLNKTNRTRLCRQSMKDLREDLDLPVLEQCLGNRVAFAEAASAHLTVFEWRPHSTASSEMSQVAVELEHHAFA